MAKKEKTEAPQKEHKKNWREVYASVEDIERYLSDHVQLRKNVISCRVECHLLNRNPWESYDGSEESAMDLLMAMNNQQQSVDETPTLWRPIDDRIVNSLWKDFSKQKPVRIQDIYHIHKVFVFVFYNVKQTVLAFKNIVALANAGAGQNVGLRSVSENRHLNAVHGEGGRRLEPMPRFFGA